MKMLHLYNKYGLESSRLHIGTLEYNGKYKFYYTNEFKDIYNKSEHSTFPGFPDINNIYMSETLFTTFVDRLPNSKRLKEFSERYNISENSSDIEKLIVSKGKQFTDNFELIQPFEESALNNKLEIEITGVDKNEMKKCLHKISVNDILKLELHPENEHDEYCVKVIHKRHLGHVPRYYSKNVFNLVKNNKIKSVKVSSINKFINKYIIRATITF